MDKEIQQKTTIGDLQQELLATIETGTPIDYSQVRKVNGMLMDLRMIFSRALEPNHEEVEEEIAYMVRNEIDKIRLDREVETED